VADRTTRILLEIIALDRATAVLGGMMDSLQAWADRMNAVSEETTLSSEQLEAVQVRLQGASDAYDRSLEAQAASLGVLKAAQEGVTQAQQAAVAAHLEAEKAAQDALYATDEEAASMVAYAKTAARASADAAAAVKLSVDEQVAAYDKLMASDALVAKRSQQLADAQAASNGETDASTASLGRLAPAALAVGAAMGYIGYKSVEAAANFQTVMTKLVTSAGQSASGLAAVSAQVLQISDQTGTSATELAKALYYVDSANYHDAQSTQILAAAAKGAKDEMANTADVTNALTTVMKNYNMTSDQATMVMNQMITAVSLGKTNLQEYSVALAQVLPLAAAAGLSFGEVGGALSTMTAKGMTAQQAAQDLAFSIRALQGPNGQAVKEMEQLGLSATQVQQSLGKNGLVATFEEIQNAVTSHMGPAGTVVMDAFNRSKTAAADAKKMFDALPGSLKGLATQLENGTISANNWRLAIRNLSPDQQKMMQEFATLRTNADSFNSFLRSGAPTAQSYTAAMQKMMGGAAGLNTALMLTTGSGLQQFQSNVATVTAVAHKANTEVDGWTQVQGTFNQKMSEAKQTLINTGIAIGTALLPYVTKLMGVIIGILTPIGQWISQHQKLIALLLAIVGPMLMVVGVFLTLTKIVGLARAAMLAFDAAMTLIEETNPIILALTAIIVVVVLLIQHWQQVKAVLSVVWAWMKVAAKDVADFFVRIWRDVANFVKGIWDDITGYFKLAWLGLKLIWDATGGKAVTAVEHAWDTVSASFTKEWDRISSDLSQIWQELVTIWNSSGGKLVSWISDNWNTISSFTSEVWDQITAPIRVAFKLFMDIARPVLSYLAAEIRSGWDLVRGITQVAWDFIKGIVRMTWDVIRGIVQGAVEAIWGMIKGGFEIVVGVLEVIWDTIKGVINEALDFIKDVLRVFIDVMSGNWGKAWRDILKTVTDVWNNIWDLVKNVINDIKDTVLKGVADVWNGFINGTESALGGIWNALVDAWNTVQSMFKDAIHWLEAAGENIINGLINGIESAVGGLWNTITGIGSGITGTFSKILKILSPSQVFYGHGVNIVAGLVNGINASAGAAANAARTLAHGVIAGAQGATLGNVSLSAGAAGGSLFAGAASAAGRPVVNFTADLRGAQIAGPQSMQWITDQLNKNFVQKVVPTAGVTTRRVSG
jgi:TP901 family phage tail tape measure protein